MSSREAEKRLGQDGENILRGKKKKSIIAEFFEQFKDFTVIVLLIASGSVICDLVFKRNTATSPTR